MGLKSQVTGEEEKKEKKKKKDEKFRKGKKKERKRDKKEREARVYVLLDKQSVTGNPECTQVK